MKGPRSTDEATHDGSKTMTTNVIIPHEYRAADGRIDVERLKARVGIADLAGELTTLKRVGVGRHKGLCPFHDENTPSFFVDADSGLWHCFGCGRGGDAVSLLLEAGADGFLDACGRLAEASGVGAPRTGRPGRNADAHRARVALARREWRSAVAIPGTPAEHYLAARGLAGNVPGSLRFARTFSTWDERTDAPGPRRPALIAAAQDVDGRITGIQRVFVDPKRRGFPFRPLRLSLGRIRGSALRLGPVREEIMLTGSLEDGLALMRMFVGATVWASLGEANLAGVVLPPVVRSVIVFGDADDPGRAAAARARAAFEAHGLRATELFPRLGKDANAEWIALEE